MLRRLTNSDLEDAPDAAYVTAIQDSVNKLVDKASTPDKPQSIILLQQADIEAYQITIQVPDPWHAMTLTAPWTNGAGTTAAWMKHYDGSIELKGNPKGGAAFTGIASALPKGARPAENRIYSGDDGGGTRTAFTIDTSGGLTALTAGTNGMSLACRYMASDATPIIPSCFPILISTKLKSVAGMWVARVEDNGNAGATAQAYAGSAFSVDFTTTMHAGKLQIKVNNIMGLPYNRSSRVTLVALGCIS